MFDLTGIGLLGIMGITMCNNFCAICYLTICYLAISYLTICYFAIYYPATYYPAKCNLAIC